MRDCGIKFANKEITKRQAYPLSGTVAKDKAVIPFHMGKIKGFLTAVQH